MCKKPSSIADGASQLGFECLNLGVFVNVNPERNDARKQTVLY
jgi:hypothetical protein